MLRYCFLLLTYLSFALLSAQVLAFSDDDVERARGFIESGRFSEAKTITDRLLQQAISPYEAYALNEIALALTAQFHFEEAESLYKRAVDIYRENFGEDHPDTAVFLSDLALFYDTQGRYADAEPYYIRVLEIRNKQLGSNHPDTIQTLNDLGVLYKNQGRYALAEPLYKQAINIVEDSDEFVTAVLRNNLALLYQEQFRFAESEPIYKQALEGLERTLGNDDPYIAMLLHNLGRLYRGLGRYEESEALHKRALAIDEKEHGKDHPETAISLNGLAMLYRVQGRYAEAESLYKRCLEIFQRQLGNDHPYTADTMNDWAELYVIQGRYDDAEPLFDQAIDVFRRTGMAAHYGQVWHKNRANLYKATNRSAKAVADLKIAMDLSLEVRRLASGSAEQRAHTFSRYYNLFEMMVDWQHELGDMNEVYESMERSRAQGLKDIMDANGIDLLVNVSEEIARPLREAEKAALTAIAIAEGNNQPDALSVARQNLADARAAIRSASPAYQLMIGENRPAIPFETIREELVSEKTLALQYLVGADKSYLLIYGFDVEPKLIPLMLTERQAQIFSVESGYLTAAKLTSLLRNEEHFDGVLELLANQRNAEASDGMLDIAAMEKLPTLWMVLVPDNQVRAKIIDGKTFDKVLIIPDGTLAWLPFEALIVLPDVLMNPFYLLDLGPPIIYAPSATMFYNLKHRPIESGTRSTLTVGNPDYAIHRDAQPTDRLRAMHSTRRAALIGDIPQLPETEKETRWIEESGIRNDIPVTRFNLAQSTEENVRNNVAGKKIVHLACHGYAEDDLGSMLALTIGNPNDPKDDGFLELAEMFDLDLRSSELVVLSACVTNRGHDQYGEGTWSMGRGMLASGASRVVTTNWNVEDAASALLMYAFIDRIQTTSSPDYAVALRQAKLDLRKHPDRPEWRHPFFWAGYVLIGPN